MQFTRWRSIVVLSVVASTLSVAGCAKRNTKKTDTAAAAVSAGPPPEWVTHVDLDADKLCGIGVAGAGFDEFSPYPKELSRERAVRNIAGVLGTSVHEAIIDRNTNSGQSIEMERALDVDADLIALIEGLAESEFWLDRAGAGPYAQKNFTYSHTCVDMAEVAATFKIAPDKLAKVKRAQAVSPDKVPSWIKSAGPQSGGRMCAVGFSMPMFFADKTFEAVVEDVRGQLAEVITTLVSQYSEELTTAQVQAIEIMTVASTEALAKGVIVTDFWYDRDGRGPNQKTRTTYGWGCVFPMDVLAKSLEAVEEKLPEDEQQKVAAVRQRAEQAFDALEAEVEKREGAQSAVSD